MDALMAASAAGLDGRTGQMPPLPSSGSPLEAAAAAAAQAMAVRSFLEKLNSSFALNPPAQVELRPSAMHPGRDGVWAAEKIPAGARYGPFLGKWALEATNPEFAWEVSQII